MGQGALVGLDQQAGRPGLQRRQSSAGGQVQRQIEGTGTHLWVYDKHRKFRQYGTWHLLDSPEGLRYQRYFHDKTSVWDGTRAQAERKICQFQS